MRGGKRARNRIERNGPDRPSRTSNSSRVAIQYKELSSEIDRTGREGKRREEKRRDETRRGAVVGCRTIDLEFGRLEDDQDWVLSYQGDPFGECFVSVSVVFVPVRVGNYGWTDRAASGVSSFS